MTNQPPAHKSYTSSNETIHMWGVGAIADYMMYAMFALIPQVCVNSIGMSPILVSWALFLPRIIDGIADPIIGHWSDTTHTKWGRRRPFIYVAGIVGSCIIMMIWWVSPNWSSMQQFGYLLLMSTLIFLFWGTYSMNHLALGYELSDDYHARTKVIAVRGFYFSCAATAGSYFYWIVTNRDFFSNDVLGIRVLSIVIAFVTVAVAVFVAASCRERFQMANRKHVNIIQAIKATLQVKAFVILLCVRVIATLGASLAGGFTFYIAAYSVCKGDKHLAASLSIWNGLVGLAVAATLVFIAAKFSKAVGKRHGLIMSYGVTFISACALPFMAQPGYPYLLLAHMILFGPILTTLFNVFQQAVMPDICDIDEVQSGERREGLFAAVGSFVNKLENSLCVLLTGYIVAWSGFDAKHAAAGIQQTPEVLNHLRWYGFTPAIIFSGIAFLLIWKYPVTHQMMEQVRATLDARRKPAELKPAD